MLAAKHGILGVLPNICSIYGLKRVVPLISTLKEGIWDANHHGIWDIYLISGLKEVC